MPECRTPVKKDSNIEFYDSQKKKLTTFDPAKIARQAQRATNQIQNARDSIEFQFSPDNSLSYSHTHAQNAQIQKVIQRTQMHAIQERMSNRDGKSLQIDVNRLKKTTLEEILAKRQQQRSQEAQAQTPDLARTIEKKAQEQEKIIEDQLKCIIEQSDRDSRSELEPDEKNDISNIANISQSNFTVPDFFKKSSNNIFNSPENHPD